MLKVMADPLNKDFNKNLPDGYKAVDVLQQYRLFFKIITDLLVTDEVIYFVWINDEESLHRSGKPDDCYEIFRKKLECSEIEPSYKLHGGWGDSVVYASYKRTLEQSVERADSHLHLSRTKDREYRIDAITVSHEDMGLASELMESLCADAAKGNVTLTHELYTKATSAAKDRHIISKRGFVMVEAIDDIEIWVKAV